MNIERANRKLVQDHRKNPIKYTGVPTHNRPTQDECNKYAESYRLTKAHNQSEAQYKSQKRDKDAALDLDLQLKEYNEKRIQTAQGKLKFATPGTYYFESVYDRLIEAEIALDSDDSFIAANHNQILTIRKMFKEDNYADGTVHGITQEAILIADNRAEKRKEKTGAEAQTFLTKNGDEILLPYRGIHIRKNKSLSKLFFGTDDKKWLAKNTYQKEVRVRDTFEEYTSPSCVGVYSVNRTIREVELYKRDEDGNTLFIGYVKPTSPTCSKKDADYTLEDVEFINIDAKIKVPFDEFIKTRNSVRTTGVSDLMRQGTSYSKYKMFKGDKLSIEEQDCIDSGLTISSKA